MSARRPRGSGSIKLRHTGRWQAYAPGFYPRRCLGTFATSQEAEEAIKNYCAAKRGQGRWAA